MKNLALLLGADAIAWTGLMLVFGIPAIWSGEDPAGTCALMAVVVLICNAMAGLWMLYMKLLDWSES